MREEFEKLLEIFRLIELREIEWCDKKQTYIGDDNDLMFFAQGAWYAWQEQHKKIDKVFHYLDCASNPLDIEIDDIRSILK